jgi:hypothetical protein
MIPGNLRGPFFAALVLGLACHRSAPLGARTAVSTPSTEAQIPAMTVDELAAALERPGTVAVYDANTRERYEQGHIPTARHVGHDEVTPSVLPADRGMRLVFYCYNEH